MFSHFFCAGCGGGGRLRAKRNPTPVVSLAVQQQLQDLPPAEQQRLLDFARAQQQQLQALINVARRSGTATANGGGGDDPSPTQRDVQLPERQADVVAADMSRVAIATLAQTAAMMPDAVPADTDTVAQATRVPKHEVLQAMERQLRTLYFTYLRHGDLEKFGSAVQESIAALEQFQFPTNTDAPPGTDIAIPVAQAATAVGAGATTSSALAAGATTSGALAAGASTSGALAVGATTSGALAAGVTAPETMAADGDAPTHEHSLHGDCCVKSETSIMYESVPMNRAAGYLTSHRAHRREVRDAKFEGAMAGVDTLHATGAGSLAELVHDAVRVDGGVDGSILATLTTSISEAGDQVEGDGIDAHPTDARPSDADQRPAKRQRLGSGKKKKQGTKPPAAPGTFGL